MARGLDGFEVESRTVTSANIKSRLAADYVPALSPEIVEEEDQVPGISREIVEEGDTVQITSLETLVLHHQSQRENQLKAGSNASAKKLVRPTASTAADNLSTMILSYTNDVKATRIGGVGKTTVLKALIDIKVAGIPDPTSENGCKILLTSRKHVVFRNMNVIKVIEVKTISRKEARKLFYKQVGRVVPSREIQPFAEAIVKCCGGLPLLIIVAGRTLAEENEVSVWKHASRKFSQPKTARVFQIEDAIQRLKFSFDQLKDHYIKSCFLHCALFPEDGEVGTSNFIDYCIKESIIIGPQADAHKRGRYIIDVLVRKSLLEVTKDGDSIKMQGLIRDLALGILSSAAEGSQFLLKPYSRHKELSNQSSSSSRSVNGSEIGIFPIPVGDQLLLRAGAGLTEPPSEEEWKQAKMIFLMDDDLRSLLERPYCPELFTLLLQRNTQLKKIPISFFDSMTSLKVLNLSNTRINSWPKTLLGLKYLQILALQDCERFDMLPSEVGSLDTLELLDLKGTEIHKLPDEIGKLASLRHLKVSFYGSLDDRDERWSEDEKFVKSEVSKLKKLSCISFHFPEIEHVQHFFKESIPWTDQRLTKFNFVVGPDVQRITSRELTVEDCPAIEEIIVQEMVDSRFIALPSLRKLALHSLPGLINIWKSVWPSLEYVSFYDCPKLRKLGMDSRLKHTIIEIKAEKSWWDTLEWEDSLTIICEDDE
ncbi:hypothetical protein Pint_26074 [Pistacia integerrima]|uniref:Uncharacterized protein n=1 Tax=Pistacia integerrima TaxID=434235 RepID=A0ACC0YED7_9ROSI|nr:hypothetical protein Pint_26074 [Pistacia integerrima]